MLLLLLIEVAPSLEMGILTVFVVGVGRKACTKEIRTKMTIQRRRVVETAGAAAKGIIITTMLLVSILLLVS